MTSATFWDRVARKYAQSPISDMAAYEASLARTRAHLNSSDRVLELGSGTGSTALLLAPDVAHITASDISTEMTKIATEKVVDQGMANLTPIQGVVGNPGLDGPYNSILAFNLLHLVPDLDACIAQVFAQLPSGGLFISKTPCLGWKGIVLGPVIAGMRLFGKAPRVRFLGVAELDRIINDAGFEIIETGDYPRKTPSHFVVARKP